MVCTVAATTTAVGRIYGHHAAGGEKRVSTRVVGIGELEAVSRHTGRAAVVRGGEKRPSDEGKPSGRDAMESMAEAQGAPTRSA